MTTQALIHLSFGTIFVGGLFIAFAFSWRQRHRLPVISNDQLLRRSGIRLGFCTLPYLAIASLLQVGNGNGVLFHGYWFWSAVLVVPGLGFVLDLSRLATFRDNRPAAISISREPRRLRP